MLSLKKRNVFTQNPFQQARQHGSMRAQRNVKTVVSSTIPTRTLLLPYSFTVSVSLLSPSHICLSLHLSYSLVFSNCLTPLVLFFLSLHSFPIYLVALPSICFPAASLCIPITLSVFFNPLPLPLVILLFPFVSPSSSVSLWSLTSHSLSLFTPPLAFSFIPGWQM